MTHMLDADELFIHRVQQHSAEAGLNFFLVEPLWVEAFYEHFRQGQVWTHVLLNMHSEHHMPDDVFHRLVLLAAEKNVQVIDPPHVARAAFDKACIHPRLVEAGIPVPETIIVSAHEITQFQLAPQQIERLKLPFVVKPACGYGRRGVILDARDASALQQSARDWPDTHYLLQQRITSEIMDGEPVYFRLFYVFGSVWCCWWNCYTDHYRVVTATEYLTLKLHRAEAVIRKIAALSGMNFFSTEFAQPSPGEFIAIDYVNDQCHMLSQTASPSNGVPDDLVAAIAKRLVEAAAGMIQTNRPRGNNVKARRDPVSSGL
jgi:hypothetical protein